MVVIGIISGGVNDVVSGCLPAVAMTTAAAAMVTGGAIVVAGGGGGQRRW